MTVRWSYGELINTNRDQQWSYGEIYSNSLEQVTPMARITKEPEKVEVAAQAFTGGIFRRLSTALVSQIPFVGYLTKRIPRAYAASVNFAGMIFKTGKRPLAAGVNFAGGVAKRISKLVSGTLSTLGEVARLTTGIIYLALASTVSFAGATTKKVARTVDGVLFTTGRIIKRKLQALASLVSFAGDLTYEEIFGIILKTLEAGIAFTGSIPKRVGKRILGTVSFTGAISRVIRKIIAGIIQFAGYQVKQISRSFISAINFIGKTFKQLQRIVSGVWTSTADLVKWITARVFFLELEAAQDFTGRIYKATDKIIVSHIFFAGSVGKWIAKKLRATIRFPRRLIRRLIRHFCPIRLTVELETVDVLATMETISADVYIDQPFVVTPAFELVDADVVWESLEVAVELPDLNVTVEVCN